MDVQIALKQMGPPAADELLAILEGGQGWGPVVAGHALADLGDRRAVGPLLRRMRAFELGSSSRRHIDEWKMLAHSLARLEPPASPGADELLTQLEHGRLEIAWYAGELLAEIGDRRAEAPLLRRLQSIDLASSTEDEVGIWSSIAEALGELKAADAVDPLTEAMPVFARDFPRFWVAAECAALALGEIGDERAVPELAGLLEPEPPMFVGNAVVNALTEIGTPEARQAIEAWEARDTPPPDRDEWVTRPIRAPWESRFRWWLRSLRWRLWTLGSRLRSRGTR
jgi:HEAT repeat protein